jgi:hypothetical protein
MHLENQADEVREDRRSSGLRFDGRHTLTSPRPDYRQTARGLVEGRENGGVCDGCLNVRNNVRAWEGIVSERRKYVSALEALPFHTERVNSALEGLIVINLYPFTSPSLSSLPKSRGNVRGQSPLGTFEG